MNGPSARTDGNPSRKAEIAIENRLGQAIILPDPSAVERPVCVGCNEESENCVRLLLLFILLLVWLEKPETAEAVSIRR